ncbi:MAG: cation:proton antiporter, partial [Pseudoflavonifractor sp.]
MLTHFYARFGATSSASGVIISIALMLFCGFAMTRITKPLRLPNVTAYIITGILIGPFCLNAIPGNFIASTDFLTDIALSFIAFGVGEYFKISTLKKSGAKAAVITIFESLSASLAIFILTYFVLHLSMAFSL